LCKVKTDNNITNNIYHRISTKSCFKLAVNKKLLNMKRVFAFMIVLTAFNCSAQNVPAEVKAAFAKSFPNTTVKKWDKEDGNYEANFTKDGKTMSATFDAK